MKKLLSVFCLVTTMSMMVSAQERKAESFPFHTISKPVHQMAFKNTDFVPASITIGSAGPLISKNVHYASLKRSVKKGVKIKTGGTPPWVISKGVARMQYERNAQ